MDEDKKPPQRQHKDYGGFPRPRTGPFEIPVPHVIASSKPDRHDPTPPPIPGSVSNEDLAVKLKDVEKVNADFQGTTTQRLSNVESQVTSVVSKVSSMDVKVDKMIGLQLDAAKEKQTFTLDVMKMHGEVGTANELADIKVKESKQLDTINAGAEKRKRVTKAILTGLTLIGSGGILHWLLGML